MYYVPSLLVISVEIVELDYITILTLGLLSPEPSARGIYYSIIELAVTSSPFKISLILTSSGVVVNSRILRYTPSIKARRLM